MDGDFGHATSPIITRDESHALFGQTMGFVALTTGFFAIGAYLGRDMAYQWGWLWFILAIACLFGLNARRSDRNSSRSACCSLRPADRSRDGAHDRLLRSTNPQAVWQAGGATALFIAGFGAAGYATRRDLSGLARLCFFALLALIIFGIVTIFVRIPNGQLIYAVLGLSSSPASRWSTSSAFAAPGTSASRRCWPRRSSSTC